MSPKRTCSQGSTYQKIYHRTASKHQREAKKYPRKIRGCEVEQAQEAHLHIWVASAPDIDLHHMVER
jgi:hypothetical protein